MISPPATVDNDDPGRPVQGSERTPRPGPPDEPARTGERGAIGTSPLGVDAGVGPEANNPAAGGGPTTPPGNGSDHPPALAAPLRTIRGLQARSEADGRVALVWHESAIAYVRTTEPPVYQYYEDGWRFTKDAERLASWIRRRLHDRRKDIRVSPQRKGDTAQAGRDRDDPTS